MKHPQHSRRFCAVIGANGYIGKHLSFSLASKGFIVSNYDIQHSSILPNYQIMDVTDIEKTLKLQDNFDYIFFLSGMTGTHNAFEKYSSYIIVNEIGLLNILNFCRHCKSKPRIVFISTRLVYRGADKPLKEYDAKYPKSVYAVNKLAGEYLIKIYQNSFDIPFTIFRLCIPYGNQLGLDYSFGTIGNLFQKAFKNEPIILYGDGNQKRTFSHIDDICYQIIECIKVKKSENEIYNLSGETFSLKDVATLISQKYSTPLQFSKWPERDLRIESGHTYFDSSKIGKIVENPVRIRFIDWIKSL
jgi:UDP-glucose 4-epimerase